MPWYKALVSKHTKVGENVRTLGTALFIVLLIRSSIAAPYKIPTGSMIPTLQIGDHIFVSKLTYGLKLPFTNYNITTWAHPQRGDVVVFKFPKDDSKDFIKRVIGLPGERIEVRGGQVLVNNAPLLRQSLDQATLTKNVEKARRNPEGYMLYLEKIDEVEHYILHNRDFFISDLSDINPVIVPEGSYFVMGDNRDDSKDSRDWGFVKFTAIRGRALAVFFSLRRDPLGIRWDRFGQVIR